MSKPLYSIGVWDMDDEAYIPALSSKESLNIDRRELRRQMKHLRACQYTVHRKRGFSGDHDDNDTSVYIERTDGKPAAEILEGWKR